VISIRACHRTGIKQRRVRYNEPGQPRELTFSCYRRYAFLGRADSGSQGNERWGCRSLTQPRFPFPARRQSAFGRRDKDRRWR
jgi:hypothetical protein